MFISRKFGVAKSVVFGWLNSPLGGLASRASLVVALKENVEQEILLNDGACTLCHCEKGLHTYLANPYVHNPGRSRRQPGRVH